MRLFISVILCLVQIIVFCQSNSAKEFMTCDHASLNFSLGVEYVLKDTPFNKHIRSEYHSDFGYEMKVFSINLHAPVTATSGSNYYSTFYNTFDGNVGFNFKTVASVYIPDSVSLSLNLFDFHLGLGKDIFFFWKKFDLPIRIGANFGMAKLHIEEKLLRNPFCSLMGQVEPRIVIGKLISLGIRGEIGYDITSLNWKPKSKIDNSIFGWRHHYWSAVVSLGWVFY